MSSIKISWPIPITQSTSTHVPGQKARIRKLKPPYCLTQALIAIKSLINTNQHDLVTRARKTAKQQRLRASPENLNDSFLSRNSQNVFLSTVIATIFGKSVSCVRKDQKTASSSNSSRGFNEQSSPHTCHPVMGLLADQGKKGKIIRISTLTKQQQACGVFFLSPLKFKHQSV